MKTHLLLFGVALGVTCFPVYGQWAVVDVDAIAQITKEVQNGAQQIQITQNQYNQMMNMAKRMYALGRYRGPSNILQAVKYADQYATLARWSQCETTGNGCDPLILDDTSILAKANDFMSTMDAGLASSVRAAYSSQQVMDGNNLAAMSAVGQIRNAASQYESAISQLETDAEDDSDDAQAQLAVDQRTSNAAILQLRQTKDTNALLSAITDQLIAQTKTQRDSLADYGNAVADQQQSYQKYHSLYDGAADAWQNFLWK
jgi:hypothetical protein